MEIKNYTLWKNIPINIICRKRFSKNEEERVWYQEWRMVHLNIINMLTNYLNRKDKEWDKEIDNKTITTEQLIEFMKSRFEAMGITHEKRVEIVIEEQGKRRK